MAEQNASLVEIAQRGQWSTLIEALARLPHNRPIPNLPALLRAMAQNKELPTVDGNRAVKALLDFLLQHGESSDIALVNEYSRTYAQLTNAIGVFFAFSLPARWPAIMNAFGNEEVNDAIAHEATQYFTEENMLDRWVQFVSFVVDYGSKNKIAAPMLQKMFYLVFEDAQFFSAAVQQLRPGLVSAIKDTFEEASHGKPFQKLPNSKKKAFVQLAAFVLSKGSGDDRKILLQQMRKPFWKQAVRKALTRHPRVAFIKHFIPASHEQRNIVQQTSRTVSLKFPDNVERQVQLRLRKTSTGDLYGEVLVSKRDTGVLRSDVSARVGEEGSVAASVIFHTPPGERKHKLDFVGVFLDYSQESDAKFTSMVRKVVCLTIQEAARVRLMKNTDAVVIDIAEAVLGKKFFDEQTAREPPLANIFAAKTFTVLKAIETCFGVGERQTVPSQTAWQQHHARLAQLALGVQRLFVKDASSGEARLRCRIMEFIDDKKRRSAAVFGGHYPVVDIVSGKPIALDDLQVVRDICVSRNTQAALDDAQRQRALSSVWPNQPMPAAQYMDWVRSNVSPTAMCYDPFCPSFVPYLDSDESAVLCPKLQNTPMSMVSAYTERYNRGMPLVRDLKAACQQLNAELPSKEFLAKQQRYFESLKPIEKSFVALYSSAAFAALNAFQRNQRILLTSVVKTLVQFLTQIFDQRLSTKQMLALFASKDLSTVAAQAEQKSSKAFVNALQHARRLAKSAKRTEFDTSDDLFVARIFLIEFYEAMKRIVGNAPALERTIATYRGEKDRRAAEDRGLVETNAPYSTSVRTGVAIMFSSGYVTRIVLPRGTRCLLVLNSDFPSEFEILVRAETTFLVTKEYRSTEVLPIDSYTEVNTQTQPVKTQIREMVHLV